MSDKLNKHGLSRNIPEQVKREVRQQCGFGCVICGTAIAQYEHYEPDFAEATEHLAKGITLLCGACHDKVTRGFWSKQKVSEASKSPICIKRGHAIDAFDISFQHPLIRIGPATWINTSTILDVMGQTVLRIDPPEADGCPYRVSGVFSDDQTGNALVIDANEWKASASLWDVEVEGKTVTIRRKPRDIILRLVADPGKGITISKINLSYNGARLYGSDQTFSAEAPDGSKITLAAYTAEGCKTAISINQTSVIVGCCCNWGCTFPYEQAVREAESLGLSLIPSAPRRFLGI